ncbi:hypothetical protein F5Y05DRAFT_390856 [Hypoxylon sp. FL0543]|nr:hypothetical protein F5Y05DRAFT_390856 [Hypoxylon sp. FL0543]
MQFTALVAAALLAMGVNAQVMEFISYRQSQCRDYFPAGNYSLSEGSIGVCGDFTRIRSVKVTALNRPGCILHVYYERDCGGDTEELDRPFCATVTFGAYHYFRSWRLTC